MNEELNKQIWENTLQTCEYVSGFENSHSTLTLRCVKHNHIFTTKYENVRRASRAHHVCPICKEEDKIQKRIANGAVVVNCAYCGKQFIKPASKIHSKSELYFCCREHKDMAQRVESGEKFDIIRPDHYADGHKNYRLKALNTYTHQCAICGWSEDVDVLEVHHIDECRENNDIDNLIILCPICHRKLASHKYVLINREQIIKKE